jgi:hypothetical protein
MGQTGFKLYSPPRLGRHAERALLEVVHLPVQAARALREEKHRAVGLGWIPLFTNVRYHFSQTLRYFAVPQNTVQLMTASLVVRVTN